jgi:hypothetical protein
MFSRSVLFGTKVACCCYSSLSLKTKEPRRTESHIMTETGRGEEGKWKKMGFMTLIMGRVLGLPLLDANVRNGQYNDLDLASS